MAFPAFFDQVPALRMHDSLAQLLGTTPDGVIEYHYADAARLAGHSCPTVAIAQILTLITGATADNGFKGLGVRHARNHLLHYAEPGIDGMRLRRNDNGRTVEVQFDASTVPSDPALGALMTAVLHDHADTEQHRQFGELWQDRVRRLLLEHAEDPAVIRVRHLPSLS